MWFIAQWGGFDGWIPARWVQGEILLCAGEEEAGGGAILWVFGGREVRAVRVCRAVCVPVNGPVRVSLPNVLTPLASWRLRSLCISNCPPRFPLLVYLPKEGRSLAVSLVLLEGPLFLCWVCVGGEEGRVVVCAESHCMGFGGSFFFYI